MNVQLIAGVTDRINQIRLLTAEIVNKEILPHENELWAGRRTGALEATRQRSKLLRDGIKAKVKQAGLWAPHLPEEYGGCGLSFLEHA
jgi:acyl-CoA dehydrogenase